VNLFQLPVPTQSKLDTAGEKPDRSLSILLLRKAMRRNGTLFVPTGVLRVEKESVLVSQFLEGLVITRASRLTGQLAGGNILLPGHHFPAGAAAPA
jgi:hypothetical protein